MPGCPDDSLLSRFIDGSLDGAEARVIRTHVQECRACADTIARLESATRGPRPDAGRSPPTPPPTPVPPVGNWLHLESGDEIDDFLILAKLGSGGFATVYLAQQQSMQRRVALKVSRKRSHEAPVLSNLNHPHIVRVYDERALPAQGVQVLYMEFIPGGTLKQVMDRLRAIAPAARRGADLRAALTSHMEARGETAAAGVLGGLPPTADWFSTVGWLGSRLADALRYSHERGVLHRDVKPANILLTADGRPLLVDFNLSHGDGLAGADPAAFFGGTLDYMAPEQFEAYMHQREVRDVGPASDMYALGVVLWELLVGARPAPRGPKQPTPTDLAAMVELRRQPPDAALLPAALPPELRTTLCRLLDPDPAVRPTAAALARTLELYAIPEVRGLLSLPPQSWQGRLARRPLASLLVAGLAPNVVIAIVNILCNHKYLDLDLDQLQRDQNVVNPVVFPIGITVLVIYALPLVRTIRAIHRGEFITEAALLTAAQRCLRLPTYFSGVCLALWMSTGIAFPLMNSLQTHHELTLLGFMTFFLSQLVHGAIASSLAFLLVAWLTMRVYFPQLVRVGPLPVTRDQLHEIGRLLDQHAALLGLLPPCVLMVVTLLPQGARLGDDRSLYFALGAFGALSFTLSLFVAPLIRTALAILQVALTSTDALLYGGSTAESVASVVPPSSRSDSSLKQSGSWRLGSRNRGPG